MDRALARDGTFPGRLRDLERHTLGWQVLATARTAFIDARPPLAAGHQVLHGDFSAGNIPCDEAGTLTAIVVWQHDAIGHGGAI